jgi:hypothetical protein
LSCLSCSTAPPDNAGAATVTGRLLHHDGTPAADAPVVVEKEPKSGDLFGIFVSLGLACLSSPPAFAGCRSSHGRTAADGAFSVRLKTHSTQAVYDLVGGGSSGAAAVQARLKIPGDNQPTPDLELWEPAWSVTGPVPAARANWTPVAGLRASNVDYQLRFDANPARQDLTGPVWSFPASDRGVMFDGRVLEDIPVTATVTATLPNHQAPAPLLSLNWTAASLTPPLHPGPPPSRGKPCSGRSASGPAVPLTPCRLTDGDFGQPNFAQLAPPCPTTTSASAASACSQPQVRDLTVDLGSVRQVSLVVVRGCPFGCTIDVSGGPNAWVPVGQVDRASTSDNGLIKLPLALPARYVRVSSEPGGAGFVRELSAW